MSLSISAMSAIRFGYGIRHGEMASSGAEDLLAQLDQAPFIAPRFPEEGIAGRWRAIESFHSSIAQFPKDPKVRRKLMKPLEVALYDLLRRDQHARFVEPTFSPYGFFERLAAFWTDHFAVNARKERVMNLYASLFEAEVIRRHLADSFANLLRRATIHPAMLIYLDQVRSVGPNSKAASLGERGLNENLGRELLELHSLGVGGGYSQVDVRHASLILAGLSVEKPSGRTRFRPDWAEPDAINMPCLAKNYPGEARGIEQVLSFIDDLADHPSTAPHICRKLVTHFISDAPPEPIIDAMVAAWRRSGGNLKEVYAAMLLHPAAWENPGQKIRQPFDYIVTGLRAAGLPETEIAQPMHRVYDDVSAQGMMEGEGGKPEEGYQMRPYPNPLTTGALSRLGDPFWEPSSPEGQEEMFTAWTSSSQLTGRITWANRVAAKVPNDTNPVELAKTVLLDALRPETLTIISQAPSRRIGLSLLLASPEFNRR